MTPKGGVVARRVSNLVNRALVSEAQAVVAVAMMVVVALECRPLDARSPDLAAQCATSSTFLRAGVITPGRDRSPNAWRGFRRLSPTSKRTGRPTPRA